MKYIAAGVVLTLAVVCAFLLGALIGCGMAEQDYAMQRMEDA
jgi:hypothetical protein